MPPKFGGVKKEKEKEKKEGGEEKVHLKTHAPLGRAWVKTHQVRSGLPKYSPVQMMQLKKVVAVVAGILSYNNLYFNVSGNKIKYSFSTTTVISPGYCRRLRNFPVGFPVTSNLW